MPRPDNGTRQKLIDTASDLLWTSSYGSVSVDDICKAAGVKKGSFYHYFPSKLDLAIAAMEDYYAEFIKPDMDRIFAANVPFAQSLTLFADALIEEQEITQKKYGLVCGCPLAALGSEMIGDENNAISEKVGEMFCKCKLYIHRAIENAITDRIITKTDPTAVSEEIHDFVTGLLMMARINNSLDGLERDLKPGMFRIVGLDTTQYEDKDVSRRI